MVATGGGSINEQDLKAALAHVTAALGEDYPIIAKTRKTSLFKRTKKKDCKQNLHVSVCVFAYTKVYPSLRTC